MNLKPLKNVIGGYSPHYPHHHHHRCQHFNRCSCGYCYDCGRYTGMRTWWNWQPQPWNQPYWNNNPTWTLRAACNHG